MKRFTSVEINSYRMVEIRIGDICGQYYRFKHVAPTLIVACTDHDTTPRFSKQTESMYDAIMSFLRKNKIKKADAQVIALVQ